MRIILPTNEADGLLSKRGAHFGKANFYTIVTIENEEVSDVEVVKNPGHSQNGCGDAISNIMSLTPDALIVSGIGGSPAKGFNNAGLNVYFDKDSQTVQGACESFLANKLEKIGAVGTCGSH